MLLPSKLKENLMQLKRELVVKAEKSSEKRRRG
jgi:hypothetical protein